MITGSIFRFVIKQVSRLRADERGGVAIIMGFLMIPLVGALGVGFEISNWYSTSRGMQNAADAAAIAAATNGGANYDIEAKAVAAQYGFISGINSITVTASNTAACPGGGNTCYSVAIAGVTPLLLSQIVGYKGDAALNGAAAKQLSALAVATASNTPHEYCLLALGPKGVRSNGAPKGAMACDVMSNTDATCNGGDMGAPLAAAHGTNNGCGLKQLSNVPVVADPYAGLAVNIPPDPCPSYPQLPTKKNPGPLPASNQWAGSKSLSGNKIMCGDVQLTKDVVIDAPAGAVVVIENGQLDLNGHKLSTTAGTGLTVVFSGDISGGYTHAPTDSTNGSGTLDFAAPTSGPWKGVAMYQDPKLTNGVDIAAAGNSPAWDITGLVYLPNSSVELKGAVNKSGVGKSCFAMVVKDILVDGTGYILPNGECIPAGLGLPNGGVPERGQLVL